MTDEETMCSPCTWGLTELVDVYDMIVSCSPCTWGLTEIGIFSFGDSFVFPMHVGINRITPSSQYLI